MPSIFRLLLADLLKFERTAAETSSMATRGEVFISIPEENATILSGQPLTFSWCDEGGTTLEIRQGDDGSLVKSFPLKQGARSITIRPSDLQLTMRKRYTWNVKGLSKGPSVLNMLGPDEDKELSALLGEIEQNRELSPGEKAARKAVLLKSLQEEYPETYSFGWLIHGIAKGQEGAIGKYDPNLARYLLEAIELKGCK